MGFCWSLVSIIPIKTNGLGVKHMYNLYSASYFLYKLEHILQII